MILHWIAGYSFAQLLMLAGGPIIFLGAVIMLLEALNGKNFSMWASIAGLIWGFCWTAANLLRKQPQWNDLMVALSVVSFLASVCYCVLLLRYNKSKKHIKTSTELPVPSDKIWPPPPTSPP